MNGRHLKKSLVKKTDKAEKGHTVNKMPSNANRSVSSKLKEELDSTKEELISVKEKFRISDLKHSNDNNYLNNILSTIRLSILTLDNKLRIKRFTEDAGKLLNILDSDIGRKITSINQLVVKNIKQVIEGVIETNKLKIIEVTDGKNSVYSMCVDPFKIADNNIDGVIITFVDISGIRDRIKQDLRQKESNIVTRDLVRQVKNKSRDLKLININLKSEISDRKQAESSLKKLSKNLIDTQETERLKLSHDLHDSVNQLLSIAKHKLHNVEKSFSNNSNETPKLKSVSEAKKYIVNAIEEVRRLSKDLRPSTLDDFGINAAIIAIVEDFKIRTGTNIFFRSRNLQKRFSKDIELSLYRIVQESLHNIEKHSGADNVRIYLSQSESQILLIVSDDGKGFINNKAKLISLKKFGLIGIKERTESMGGNFTIESEKGLGTVLKIKIPVLIKN